MKTISTKKFIILYAIIAIVLVVAHFVVWALIRKDGVNVSAVERESASLKAQMVEFSQNKPEDIERLAESVTKKIISNDDLVGFIGDIEEAARSQGLSIVVRSVNVEPRSEDLADQKEKIKLQIETGGSWQGTVRYINYLEHLPYKIELTEAGVSTLNESGKSADAPLWRGRIELTALKFK